jgi:outer membrane protein TolC
MAVTSRIDLEIARMDLAILAKGYGLTRATRFIDVLEVSGRSTRERTRVTDSNDTLDPGPPPVLDRTETPAVEKLDRNGIEVMFQIPIYDFGEARTRLAEQTYLGAVNRLIDKAVNVRADAREAYQAYRGAYDIARYYDKDILPLREIISEQTLLNYNGMLSDLFGLLTDARARIAANVKAIEAKRDFWLATAHLSEAINGGARGGTPNPSTTTLAADGSGD